MREEDEMVPDIWVILVVTGDGETRKLELKEGQAEMMYEAVREREAYPRGDTRNWEQLRDDLWGLF